MLIRSTDAGISITLNAVFIFGLGLGVAGAELDTVIAQELVSVCFLWGFLTASMPIVGSCSVTVPVGTPHLDRRILPNTPRSALLVAQKLGTVVV